MLDNIKDWIDEYSLELKIAMICGFAMIMVALVGSMLEHAACNDLQSLYGNSHRVEYTWPGGCKVLTDSGYWIDDEDSYLIVK